MNSKHLLKITRPVNVIITFVTAAAAVFLAGNENIKLAIYLYTAFSAALTAAAGNIINDYFDIEGDKINHPERPLAAEKIQVSEAIFLYVLMVFTSIIIALLISLTALIIVVVVHLVLFFYSSYLKKIPVGGNITVALLTGMVFIYGGVGAGNIRNAIIPAIFAFLINLIREILKDIEDMKGDSALSLKSVPIVLGIKFTKRIIFCLTVIFIFFTFHPFIFFYYGIEYFVFIMLFVNPFMVYFLRSLYIDHTQQNLKKLSILLKLNMLTGLAAIYMGR